MENLIKNAIYNVGHVFAIFSTLLQKEIVIWCMSL
jgi:hypothetical protein